MSRQIESKERLLQIIDMMQEAFEKESPTEHQYEKNKQRLENVKAYAEGTFNLFPGSPYRKKRRLHPKSKR